MRENEKEQRYSNYLPWPQLTNEIYISFKKSCKNRVRIQLSNINVN